MKKKIIAMLLCMTMALSFAACGREETSDTESEAASTGTGSAQIEIDLEKQVTKLSDYKNLDLTITGNYDVTDEDVENNILTLLPYYGITGTEVTDRDTVQEGDYVLIDYTGYKDGEAFENGAATDVMYDVSNNFDVTNQNTYIDGFGDGLIGAKVGEEASSDVTFPENYQSEELAGQPVTFKFNVKGIYEPVTMESLTDEMVAEAFSEDEIESKDALISYVREVLENQALNYKNQASVTAAEEYILENSEVEIPMAYMEARLAEYQENVLNGKTLEEYLSENDTTLKELQDSWRETLEEQIKLEFVFRRIAELEQIEVDEEDFADFVAYIISNSSTGLTTEDEVYESYGYGNIEDGQTNLRQLYLVNQAIAFVVENANITIKEDTEDTTQES